MRAAASARASPLHRVGATPGNRQDRQEAVEFLRPSVGGHEVIRRGRYHTSGARTGIAAPAYRQENRRILAWMSRGAKPKPASNRWVVLDDASSHHSMSMERTSS